MLGHDQPIILHLIDIPQAQKALSGVAMELGDCAFPLLKEIVCTEDLKTGKTKLIQDSEMSNVPFLLVLNPEAQAWRELTFYKEMLKFLFLKERPSTNTPTEISELSLLEILPTPTHSFVLLMPRIFPRETLLPWPDLIMTELSGRSLKRPDQVSVTSKRSLFGEITHPLCPLILLGLPWRENQLSILLMPIGTAKPSSLVSKREELKSSTPEVCQVLLLQVTQPFSIWEVGSWVIITIGFHSVFTLIITLTMFLTGSFIVSLSLLLTRSGALSLVSTSVLSKEPEWIIPPTSWLKSAKLLSPFSSCDLKTSIISKNTNLSYISNLSLSRRTVSLIQKIKYLFLSFEDRNRAPFPALHLSISFLCLQLMIWKHQSFVVSNHSQISIEQVTSCKVHQGKCILIDWVMFYIDSMVLTFKIANSHIGWAFLTIKWLRMSQALCDKFLLL